VWFLRTLNVLLSDTGLTNVLPHVIAIAQKTRRPSGVRIMSELPSNSLIIDPPPKQTNSANSGKPNCKEPFYPQIPGQPLSPPAAESRHPQHCRLAVIVLLVPSLLNRVTSPSVVKFYVIHEFRLELHPQMPNRGLYQSYPKPCVPTSTPRKYRSYFRSRVRRDWFFNTLHSRLRELSDFLGLCQAIPPPPRYCPA